MAQKCTAEVTGRHVTESGRQSCPVHGNPDQGYPFTDLHSINTVPPIANEKVEFVGHLRDITRAGGENKEEIEDAIFEHVYEGFGDGEGVTVDQSFGDIKSLIVDIIKSPEGKSGSSYHILDATRVVLARASDSISRHNNEIHRVHELSSVRDMVTFCEDMKKHLGDHRILSDSDLSTFAANDVYPHGSASDEELDEFENYGENANLPYLGELDRESYYIYNPQTAEKSESRPSMREVGIA